MKKFIIFSAMFIFMASLMTACTHRLVDFTVISSKNTAVKGKVGKRVKGSDGKCGLLQPNMKEALDRAIEQEPGADALVDGVIYYKWYFVFYHKYVVEGTAINTKRR